MCLRIEADKIESQIEWLPRHVGYEMYEDPCILQLDILEIDGFVYVGIWCSAM